MMLALLLAAATPQTAVDAERAFAADAQALGQWTAFRKWAAAESTMFVPEPTRAQEWLKDRKDPPKSVTWQPVQVWQSCDGSVAVTTGYWHRPDSSVGWFTTVWKRQAEGGWRWVLDHGDVLGPEKLGNRWLESHALDCRRKPPKLPRPTFHGYELPGGGGQSPDATLRYHWSAQPKEVANKPAWLRQFTIELWDGKDWAKVLTEWVTEVQ